MTYKYIMSYDHLRIPMNKKLLNNVLYHVPYLLIYRNIEIRILLSYKNVKILPLLRLFLQGT